ncbi:MAG: MMPL family transporter [Planctomycetota bacterium]
MKPGALAEMLARFVTERWRTVLTLWIILTVVAVSISPPWDQIAQDGDFEYLPDRMNTVAAARVLDEAFPAERARSEIVLVLANEEQPLSDLDLMVGDDVLRRLHHQFAVVCWKRAIQLGYRGGALDSAPETAKKWLERALESLDRSIDVDARFYEQFSEYVPELAPTLTEPRMAIAFYDRAKLLEQLAIKDRTPGTDLDDATLLVPGIESQVEPINDRELGSWQALLEILTWDEPVIGSRLQKPTARLAVMQLTNELAATGNIETVESVGNLLQSVRQYSLRLVREAGEPSALRVEMTGSAAIGGETLIAARDAIRYTESITVIMILLILTLVYRAPLLVAVPMVSIGVAVVVSTSLVAFLTDLSMRDVLPWIDMKVFTTSRIFIVVVLFGAGTDYCLFLIARLREEAGKSPWPIACQNALSSVTSALLGSALTTVFGLAMLWFAQFGKYHHTGPIIAICLLIGLLVCLTLAPALLRGLGPRVFWPNMIEATQDSMVRKHVGLGIWSWIAIKITRRPMLTFLFGIFFLTIPGWYGWHHEKSVTYDLSSQLDTDAASRRGFRLLSKHFDVGEINPVTILLVRPEDTPREDLRGQVGELSKRLYAMRGVIAVRSANDPLGDFPPDREMSLLSSDAWRRRALQQHRLAQDFFFSSTPEFQNRLVRLDVIVDGDPFSLETAKLVSGIRKMLGELSASPSDWAGSRVYLSGTTASIIDLRSVTIEDNQRIKLAVVIAVFLILVAVIRRVVLCLYLIFTVLLSYYATLGLTMLFFRAVYGDEYVGLDWKLPLFLFVILVAVGQDYNVYLVTRIVEEQRNRGWLAALRHAVSKTGGIITACGMVMAATFLSMTASAWLPAVMQLFGLRPAASMGLRGIIELGFALGLGVLIDTFYVRTILVPSFVALVGRIKLKRRSWFHSRS